MSIDNKRMQQRYGTYGQFQNDKANLLPNEFASVTSDDPNTSSGKALYFHSETGEPNRILTDEDKASLEGSISDVEGDLNSLQGVVSNLNSTVGTHSTAISSLQLDLDDKVAMEDLEDYSYSKLETQTYVNNVLNNYYTSYIINNMLSFSSGQIKTTGSFAGYPNYFWAKLGFELVSGQYTGGICLFVLDSPVCTSGDTSLTIPLPFISAADIQISVTIGTTTRLFNINANSQEFIIDGIQNGDKVSTTFAYRVRAEEGQG